MTRSEAMRLRAAMETGATSLDDKTASGAAQMFPGMKLDGGLIAAGTRINWNGVVKRAAVDLWDTAENTPETAPTLWEDLMYRDGIRIIPETITAGTAFSEGEYGWWGDVLYISRINNNVWTPAAYPDGWAIAEQSE